MFQVDSKTFHMDSKRLQTDSLLFHSPVLLDKIEHILSIIIYVLLKIQKDGGVPYGNRLR